MMANPLEIKRERGDQASTQLTATAAATTYRTLLSPRMGGTMMAMNML